MSEQNWGCLDKMSEVNFSPAETLYMNMFARFDENPAMTLQDIKKTKRYGRMDGRTHGRTHGQRENSIPTTNKVCGGYKKRHHLCIHKSLIREKLSKFSQLSYCQKLFFLSQTPSCICSMCLHCIGKVSNCSIKSCGRS